MRTRQVPAAILSLIDKQFEIRSKPRYLIPVGMRDYLENKTIAPHFSSPELFPPHVIRLSKVNEMNE